MLLLILENSLYILLQVFIIALKCNIQICGYSVHYLNTIFLTEVLNLNEVTLSIASFMNCASWVIPKIFFDNPGNKTFLLNFLLQFL